MAIYSPEIPPLNDDSLSYGYEAIREMLHTRTTRPIKPVASFLNFGSLPEMFYVQVAHNPAATAFIQGSEAITYAQLAERANQIAKQLLELKIGLGDVVGISLERSFDMVAALIAVLQTGAAYLPLDPSYPQERLMYIRQDAGVQAIIATRATLEKLKVTDTKTILLDTLPAKRNSRTYAPSKTLAFVSPDSPAYMIYTSGSTGKPKGVVVPHRQIVNRFQWMWHAYPFEPQEVGCQRTALNFVDSIWEIFGYLLQGIPTVIIPDETLRDPLALVDELARHRVSRLWLVPSLLRIILDSIPNLAEKLPDLTFWITTGETIPSELFRRFEKQMPHATVYNLYGTSEVWDVTWYPPEEAHAHLNKIPIGKPIKNYTAYILDDQLNPVPIGTPGMLYVGGLGLAFGYHNRPDLTAERFIPNPFVSKGPRDSPLSSYDLRLYKTGDLASWLPDGNIEFLGRADFQIKIRGHRVELGEIEIAIREHPDVKNVVVVDKDAADGDKRLVAYLVMHESSEVSVIGLRKFLREKLPEHMIPTYFEFLETIPLTPNGKIDRKALPEPNQKSLAGTDEYIPPRTALERQLVEIWEELLEVQSLGVRHNFFDYGGYSLLAVRMFGILEEKLHKKLPLTTLFLHPTIEQLAEIIEKKENTIWSTVVDIQPQGEKPPFFCVHGFGGGVLGYIDLAQAIGKDQPFYGLRARGLHETEKPQDEIKDMAAYYIEAMREVQPQGPYYLGGYCLGGVIAFEMARQLQQAGEDTPVVAIFDGFAPLVKTEREPWWQPKVMGKFLRNFPLWLHDFLQLGGREMLRRILKKLSNTWLVFALRLKLPVRVDLEGIIEDVSGIPPRIKKLMETHDRALMRYQPPAYSGKVSLFRVRSQSLFGIHDEDNGWGKLSQQGVEVRMVGGAHSNILENPHVNVLAKELKETLENAYQKGENHHGA